MEALLNGPIALWRMLPTWFRGFIRATRPRQWVKSGFVFIPILFDNQFTKVGPLLRVTIAALLFTMVSSAIYLLNDTVDVERDRLHPKKKNRPIASGQLPIPLAVAGAIILPLLAIGIAFLMPAAVDQRSTVPSGIGLGVVLVAYFIKQVAYSFYLKNVVLLDVIVLAAGYVMRVLAGALVITVTNFSPWLYVCVGMLALFLAVGKRRQELILLGNTADNVRATYKEYNMALLDDMLRLVTTSSVIAYTLYTVEARSNLGGPAMLTTVPIVVYGIFRYLYLIHVKGEGGAPDEVLLKDKPLFATAVLFVLMVGIIIYVLPRLAA